MTNQERNKKILKKIEKFNKKLENASDPKQFARDHLLKIDMYNEGGGE